MLSYVILVCALKPRVALNYAQSFPCKPFLPFLLFSGNMKKIFNDDYFLHNNIGYSNHVS